MQKMFLSLLVPIFSKPKLKALMSSEAKDVEKAIYCFQ